MTRPFTDFAIHSALVTAAQDAGYDVVRSDGAVQILSRVVTDGLRPAVSIRAKGASPDNTAAENVTAIRAAMADAVAGRKALYIPTGTYLVNNNFTFDGDWSGLTVYGDGPSSCLKIGTSLDEDANVEAGWTLMLDGASNGALENFTLRDLRVDGSRLTLTGFDPANTTQGVVIYPDSNCHNVQVENVWAHSYLQGSGFAVYAGGVRIVDCHGYDNDYHGGFASRDTTFGDADKVAEWVNFTAHDNGQLTPFDGCGLDVGRYCRCIVTNLNSYWNGQGMKFSIGTELLIVRGARLAYNLFNGFQDTDTVGSAILDLDGIVTHNNGGLGFRLVSGSNIRIGSINSYSNYCSASGHSRSGNGFTGGTPSTAGDIHIGTSTGFIAYFEADSLRSKASTIAGIHLDGNIRAYRIGYVESVEAQTYGFGDYIQGNYTAWADATAYVVGDIVSYSGTNYLCTTAHTSVLADNRPSTGSSWETKWQVMVTDGVVESGLMVQNNNAGTAASAAACAMICERAGGIKFQNIMFRDTQGTVTQHSGMYFSSGADAFVDGCHFGSGITAGSEVYTANTPTRVRFGHNNTGTLVTRARGTLTVDGGTTTASVTYATAISNLGGAVLFPMVYPSSADASEANYISAVSRTALTVTCPTTFAAGTGNVAFRYDVQMEVQR